MCPTTAAAAAVANRTVLAGHQYLLTTRQLNVRIKILCSINIFTRGFLLYLCSIKTTNFQFKCKNNIHITTNKCIIWPDNIKQADLIQRSSVSPHPTHQFPQHSKKLSFKSPPLKVCTLIIRHITNIQICTTSKLARGSRLSHWFSWEAGLVSTRLGVKERILGVDKWVHLKTPNSDTACVCLACLVLL